MSHFVTSLKSLAVVLLALSPVAALAEDTANPCPSGTVASGSSDVTVEGKQAGPRRRQPPAAPAPSPKARPTCSSTASPPRFRAARPAAAAPIASGATGVFVNGKPFVIAGSAADCPDK